MCVGGLLLGLVNLFPMPWQEDYLTLGPLMGILLLRMLFSCPGVLGYLPYGPINSDIISLSPPFFGGSE